MSFSEVINNSPVQVDTNNVNYEAEISDLDTKIQKVAQEIDLTNKDLAEVNAELRDIDPSLVGENRYFTTILCIFNPLVSLYYGIKNRLNSEKIAELQIRKRSYEVLRLENHEQLGQYEQSIHKCNQAFSEYQSRMHPEIDPYEKILKELEKGEIAPKDVLIQGYDGITDRQQLLPIGKGLDPEVKKHEERAQRLFERAMSSKTIKDLYIEAVLTPHPFTRETGPWRIEFSSDASEFGAQCTALARVIQIDPNLSDDIALTNLVFELTNAVKSSRFVQLHLAVMNGKISRGAYAKAVEREEHAGALRHHVIMTRAIKEMGWDTSMDVFRNVQKEFYYEWERIKNGRHTERYRTDFDTIQQGINQLKQEKPE